MNTSDRSEQPDPFNLPTPASRRAGRRGWIGLWVLPALLLAVPGCNQGSSGGDKTAKGDPAPAGQANPADAAANPPANPAPAPAPGGRGRGRGRKPAAAEDSAADTSSVALPKDPSRWGVADLKLALTRKDQQFSMAVQSFSAQHPNDDRGAQDLDSLLQQAAKMKDDQAVPLPIVASGTVGNLGSPLGFRPLQNGSPPSSMQPERPRKRNKKDD